MITKKLMDSDEPLSEDILEYYEELANTAEVVYEPERPQHIVTHILDGSGFEALYVDGELVGDSHDIWAHEAIAAVAERLGLPIKVTWAVDDSPVLVR